MPSKCGKTSIKPKNVGPLSYGAPIISIKRRPLVIFPLSMVVFFQWVRNKWTYVASLLHLDLPSLRFEIPKVKGEVFKGSLAFLEVCR